MRSTEYFYDWLRNTLIPFVFPLTWYNGRALNSFERQNTKDQANYRLGPVRLRQLRVKESKIVNLFITKFRKPFGFFFAISIVNQEYVPMNSLFQLNVLFLWFLMPPATQIMESLRRMSAAIVRAGDYLFVMSLKHVGLLKLGSLPVPLTYGVFQP